MRPIEVAVSKDADILSGAQYADAFQLALRGESLNALTVAQRAFGRAPRWISRLMRLRNFLTGPLGLKPGAESGATAGKMIGVFPVLDQSADRIVLGLDDQHLDFRLLVDVADLGLAGQVVTASTLIRTHNALGRLYLAVVKPFHRIIVPAMLAQAQRA